MLTSLQTEGSVKWLYLKMKVIELVWHVSLTAYSIYRFWTPEGNERDTVGLEGSPTMKKTECSSLE